MRALTGLATSVAVVAVLAGCSPLDPSTLPACSGTQVVARVAMRAVGSGAGVVALDLTITNGSDAACALPGAPTLHIVDVQGDPVGDGAVIMSDRPNEAVALPPRGVAYSLVETTKAMPGFPGCDPIFAQGMRVELPGITGEEPLVVPSPVAQYCDIPELDTFLVSGFALAPVEGHDHHTEEG